MGQSLVLDASVAVKWFLDEEGRLAADKILKAAQDREITIFLPQLFFFEFVSVLSRRPDVRFDEIKEAIEVIFSLEPRTEVATPLFLEQVAKMAQSRKISGYDASYVVLAQVLKINFLTADKKLKDKVKLPFVKLL